MVDSEKIGLFLPLGRLYGAVLGRRGVLAIPIASPNLKKGGEEPMCVQTMVRAGSPPFIVPDG